MRYATSVALIACSLAFAPSLVHSQGGGAERQRLLAAVVARGDRALADGKAEQAREAWTLVLAFEPTNAIAKRKVAGLTASGGNFALSNEEQAFSRDVISNSWGDEWCDFPPPASTTELINLKMLADARLLPNLQSTTLSLTCKGSGATAVFLFLAKPGLSISEVRQIYGPPASEKKHGNGAGFEALTYGRFRLLFGKDGNASAVFFLPFPAK